MQIGCDQLRSQFSVGSGDRTDLTTSHLHRRATFIHINVRSFGTKDRVVRTSHQLQGNDIAACSIENKQWLTIGYKRFFNFPDSFFCPQIVAIAQGMIPVSPCQASIMAGCTPELLSEAKLLIVSLHFKLDGKVTDLFSKIK